MSGVEKVSIHSVAIIIGILLSLLISSWMLSWQTVIEVTNAPAKIINVVRGKSFRYCRDVEYFKTVEIRLDKSLVRRVDEATITPFHYPSFYDFRNAGFSETICKDSFFPDFIEEDGVYVMKTAVTYTLWGWQRTVGLKDIYLNVVTAKDLR